MRFGYVGIGNMGGPMAQNLIRDGHKVKAFDLVGHSQTAIQQVDKFLIGTCNARWDEDILRWCLGDWFGPSR